MASREQRSLGTGTERRPGGPVAEDGPLLDGKGRDSGWAAPPDVTRLGGRQYYRYVWLVSGFTSPRGSRGSVPPDSPPPGDAFAVGAAAGPPKLAPEQLRTEHERTLATERRRYGLPARCLFALLDVLYGRARTLSKFKVLEVVARVPYQAWENVAYVAVTHRYSRPGFARRISSWVQESRTQQDNEQFHLLILEELVEAAGRRESFIRYRVLPQILAFAYYQLSWVLYALRPEWSYGLNADFEDHAEHEYALFVIENPDLADRPYAGLFADEYGRFDSLADLFRQIGYDERVHKEESLARMTDPRFR